MNVELTPKEVGALIRQRVGQLDDIARNFETRPLLTKQEVLPILARIQELLTLIPDPSVQTPPEVEF